MSNDTPSNDEHHRAAIRSRLDVGMVVEAAAGTGKTTELVHRMVECLRTGKARVDGVVAVTFTEKAAGELKLRLRSALEEARRRHPDNAGLAHALAHLEEAHVNTIHGFCAELLKARPVEARVDPLFRVLTEPQARRLHNQAFQMWLQTALSDPPPGVRRALHRPAVHAFDDGPSTPRQRLEQASWDLLEWRDLSAPWQRPEGNAEALAAACVTALAALHQVAHAPDLPEDDRLYKDLLPALLLHDQLTALGSVGPLNPDLLEASLLTLARQYRFRNPSPGRGRMYARGVPRDVVKARHAQALGALQAFAAHAEADLAALLQDELRGAAEDYAHAKRQSGALDFTDLLICTRQLLRESTEARAALQARFTHLFVDEFQDTDPVQAEIILLLCAADPSLTDWRSVVPVPGKLFVVGDPRQSIYRFRRADVGTYLTVRDHLVASGALFATLTRNHRSTPGIQGAVNAAFGPTMVANAQTQQAGYVALQPHRDALENQPAVIALAVPRPYGWRGVTKAAVEESLPDTVGAFVDWLCNRSGWKVTPRAGAAPEPIRPAHICLVSRRMQSFGQDLMRPYVRALEARNVPHLLVGGRSFHEREEVEMVRVALTAVEWPDDALHVYATLHGGLFALQDDMLLQFLTREKHLNPMRRVDVPAELQPVADALLLLRDLHIQRNQRPASETVFELLRVTRAHAGLVLRHSGEQALANVLQVAELARQYERDGGHSFRGFVELLTEEADNGEAPEAPVLEEGADGVRIMTAYRAKGLEFPVVILTDMGAPPESQTAFRHVDPSRNLAARRIFECTPLELAAAQDVERARDTAEMVRLTYVAATRARDLLVVPAIGDAPMEGSWLRPLWGALYPPMERRRKAFAAPGCPPFGVDTVLARPDEAPFNDATVIPGLHPFAHHQVVWWDPSTLGLDVKEQGGIRRDELLKDTAAETVAADVAAHHRWQQDLANLKANASQPSVFCRTVTQDAEAPGADAPPRVMSVDVRAGSAVARGRRYGTLVHTVLAALPLGSESAAVGLLTRQQARVLGAPEEERAAAEDAVRRVLASPLWLRAVAAHAQGRTQRECPLTLTTDDGTLLDGVADLLFEEDGGFTVVDFKTDADPTAHADTHARQVTRYAEAVTAATGRPCLPVLLLA